MRRALAIVIVAAASTGAAAQTAAPAAPPTPLAAAALPEASRPSAVEYLRSLIENDRYDPRDRERAINGGHEAADAHWRSSIFDGRRTRATRSTGLRLPVLPRAASE